MGASGAEKILRELVEKRRIVVERGIEQRAGDAPLREIGLDFERGGEGVVQAVAQQQDGMGQHVDVVLENLLGPAGGDEADRLPVRFVPQVQAAGPAAVDQSFKGGTAGRKHRGVGDLEVREAADAFKQGFPGADHAFAVVQRRREDDEIDSVVHGPVRG